MSIDLAQLDPANLDALGVEQLRELSKVLLEHRGRDAREIAWRDARIDKLTFELAQLKRLKFDRTSERMSSAQRMLFEESVDADIAALDEQLTELKATLPPKTDPHKRTPKRAALPPALPRREIVHEPENTTCACGCAMKRVGEDVTEKLDYTPGVFSVERHVRGKWACAACRTLRQAPVPAAVIDKGIPTARLLAQVLVAKHADHLPLYRQEAIFSRAGVAIPRSTLAAWVGQCGARLEPLAQALRAALLQCQVLHADETPVAMLAPGTGKTQRAYLWAYAAAISQPLKAVVYDFTPSRSGEHARAFLGHDPDRRGAAQQPWTGHLICDDFSGYKALFERGVIEVGCMAHYLERGFIRTGTSAAACRRRWQSRRSLHIIPTRAQISVGAARSMLADSAAYEFRRASVHCGPRVEDRDDIEVSAACSRRLRPGAPWQLRTREASRRSRGSLVLPAGTPHVQLVA